MKYMWVCDICAASVTVERKMNEMEIPPEDVEHDPRCCLEETHMWTRVIGTGISVSFSQNWGGKGKW